MARNEKIRDLSELAAPLQAFKAEGKTIVHSHGVFDLLHIGHIRHLDQARKLGDVLVVTVTPDRFVNKGPHRPVFNQELRAEAIAALGCVDYVAINEWQTAVETIQLLRPDFYVKGSDEREENIHDKSSLSLEEEAVRSVGGRVAFTTGITFSSSNLVNQHLAVFPREVSDYLAGLPTRHSAGKIMQYLEEARSLKVLVVGEAIIDEYVYCETMGKSGKEPILAARYINNEKFAGGILAVANHVAALCDHVGVLTFLGKNDPQEDFIRQKLDPSVEKMFLYFDNAPTIVKRRFVENYPFQKLFELYMMNSDEAGASETQALCAKLRQVLPEYDVVIVTDYGHGMLGAEAIDVLCKYAPFLAVNTQINAGNQGFHSISKYPRADYICVSEKEARMEVRSRNKDVREIVLHVADKLSCDRITITRGQQGCLCYGRNEGFFDIPAFGIRIADRVGAGDAVLAVTALCVAQNAPMEVVGFIGNVVGAQAVAIVGHRRFIEREALTGHVESLLK
jgi:rfaE bifunctional protein kinase chain/domain/rfaE bifunctional protein nucleotidyltransferase chain/domain